MRAWDVSIRVDFAGGRAAMCTATVFAETAAEAREDGRGLLEAVCRSGEGSVTAVTVAPARIARPVSARSIAIGA